MGIFLELVCISVLRWTLVATTGDDPSHAISERREDEHSIRRERQTSFNLERYLEQFGYLEAIDGGGQHSEDAQASAIRSFQDFNGLAVTGVLDSTTFEKMQQPRCGLPDIMPAAFSTHGSQWDNNQVTWQLQSPTSQLPRPNQRRAFYNAFRKWSAVTPLRFREQSGGDSDIMIKFASYSHGDGPGNSFDGRGRTLAHAFFPGDHDISGDTHFDESEQWTEYSNDGTNLEIVAAHEFGHALGLGHSRDENALMAPFYKGYDPNYALGADDIQGIQTLYGASQGRVTQRPPQRPRPRVTRRHVTRAPRRTRRPVTRAPRRTRRPVTRAPRRTRRPVTRAPRRTPRPVTRRPPTPRPSGGDCNIRVDAAVVAHDSNAYIFNGKNIYKLNSDGHGVAQKSKIRHVFPEAPFNVGAVVYSIRLRKLYMFKGDKLWRYTGFSLDDGYPKTLFGYYRGIKAALEWSDGDIYVFKGSGYSVWSEQYDDIPRGYPLQTATYWAGVPLQVEAGMRFRDGYTYFFKGDNYFKFSDFSRSVVRGYPKPKSQAWLGCGPYLDH